jgi:S-sulfo-L-cysteine synthase (O-acetyl-L-serine-dependent)
MITPATPDSIVKLVGNTPLLRIHLFERRFPGLEVYAKAEWFNPGGSVKDRAALAMIEDGERSGALTRGRIIVDSTSGNTGIAYAMVGAAKGYRVQLVMPANVSAERKQLVAAYGAEAVYSDAQEGSDGAIRLVRELVADHPDRYFYPDQYNNPANPLAHYNGTGREILEQTEGRVTHFVAGLGTTGTFTGTTRRLKEQLPSIRAIAVQPQDAFHGLEGLKHLPTAIVPGIWEPGLADEVWGAPTERSYELARALASAEGLLVGHSSGAVLWAIERLATEVGRGVVVTVFPDGGDRYVSAGLYRPRTVRIAREALRDVHAHASDGYPNEICGALIATGERDLVTRARRLRNTVVERARDRYEVDVHEQRRLMRECDDAGWEIVGYYHSHPDHPAWASETDAKRSWARTVYLIVSCVRGEVVDGNAFVADIDGGPMRRVPLQVTD